MCSNVTPNFGLPQYAINDHPDFLTEINKAYVTIDTALKEITDRLEELGLDTSYMKEEIRNLQAANVNVNVKED